MLKCDTIWLARVVLPLHYKYVKSLLLSVLIELYIQRLKLFIGNIIMIARYYRYKLSNNMHGFITLLVFMFITVIIWKIY